MVNAGKIAGCRVTAALTNMDEPLGRAAGHACEVVECLDILKNSGVEDTRELSLQLAAAAAVLGHQDITVNAHENAYARMQRHLSSGRAYEVFLEIAEQQGAHLSSLELKNTEWIESGTVDIPVTLGNYNQVIVESIDTRALGILLIEMGAGRRKKEDVIDHKVGLLEIKKIGEVVEKEEPVCILRLRKNDSQTDKFKAMAASAFRICSSANAAQPHPLIADWVK
jgi:thymidine phosphorylase